MDLDPIEARANAATEGPWESDDHSHGEKGCRCLSCDVTTGWTLRHALSCYETDKAREAQDGGCEALVFSFEDAEFIAHARTDVPALVARVRELEKALDAATQFTITSPTGHPMYVEHVHGQWGIFQEAWHDDPIEQHRDRDAALARARQLSEGGK